jgi:hypothetical protein
MAYSIAEIQSDLRSFIEDYILFYADRKLIQGAYRNEYCSDANIRHMLNATPRYTMTLKILEVMSFDATKQKVFLNSQKTHVLLVADVIRFYNQTLSLQGIGYEIKIDPDCSPPKSATEEELTEEWYEMNF